MPKTYIWKGEAECLVPYTVDGPRVVEAGDPVRVADDDDSFVDNPLWERAEDAAVPAPAPVVPVVVPAPVPAPVDPEISTPDQPAVQEPTA